MRRVLLASLLAIGMVFGAGPALGGPGGAPTDAGDTKPACADIARLGWAFIGSSDPETAGTGKVVSQMELAAPACRGFTYTVYAVEDGSDRVLGSATVRGVRSHRVVLTFADIPVGTSQDVCVYATSSAGAHVFDRVPNVDGSCFVAMAGGVGYEWYP